MAAQYKIKEKRLAIRFSIHSVVYIRAGYNKYGKYDMVCRSGGKDVKCVGTVTSKMFA